MITPTARTLATPAYSVPAGQPSAGPMLRLNANECPTFTPTIAAESPLSLDAIARYPDTTPLQRTLATRLDVPESHLIITAGADDALARICTALVEPGRNIVITSPTFEMIPIYAQLAGGDVREIPWMDGAFPTEAVIAAADSNTAAVFVVSPNNPTGLAASACDLRRLRDSLPHPALILDAAYEEFADEPLTPTALTLPNTVVTRTFSKAFGLAGLRVGYAVGDPDLVALLRRVGQPYAVSGLSLDLVARWLEPLSRRAEETVRRVRIERSVLREDLRRLDLDVLPSQGNFVLARFATAARASAVAASLAARGTLVRSFQNRPELSDHLRITCPADETAFETLRVALRAALTETP
jgi:histidinol-phosphate aminotransferase